jgi:signal peptidase
MLTFVRRTLEVGLLALVLGTLGLAAASQAAPILSGGLYTVRSESMTPLLGVGELVAVEEVTPASIVVGDVITLRLAGGSTVTHRVTGIVPTDGAPMFQTRGDANGGPDPVTATADQVVGRLAWHVPLIGFLLAMLSMPTGLAALFSVGATLLTAIWLLDEVEIADDEDEDELGDALEPGTNPTAAGI